VSSAVETPIGYVPTAAHLDLSGLDTPAEDVDAALAFDAAEWKAELPLIEEWFAQIGDRLPSSMRDELDALRQRLEA
jgi:phosphoenolpyruvate carboxykinase (GTP)